MFQLHLCLFLILAILGQLVLKTDALQMTQSPSPFSRRSFFSKAATTGAVIATAAALPGSAWAAAPAKAKGNARPAYRGGNKSITDTHNGTELKGKEADVAGGLLGKMGLNDIAPMDSPRVSTKRAVTTSSGVRQ